MLTQAWYGSVLNSIVNESKCKSIGPQPPPAPPAPPSTACSFRPNMGLTGHFKMGVKAANQQECCGACLADPEACGAAVYHGKPTASGYECVLRPPGTFTLKGVKGQPTEVVCVPAAAPEAGMRAADREWVEAGN